MAHSVGLWIVGHVNAGTALMSMMIRKSRAFQTIDYYVLMILSIVLLVMSQAKSWPGFLDTFWVDLRTSDEPLRDDLDVQLPGYGRNILNTVRINITTVNACVGHRAFYFDQCLFITRVYSYSNNYPAGFQFPLTSFDTSIAFSFGVSK